MYGCRIVTVGRIATYALYPDDQWTLGSRERRVQEPAIRVPPAPRNLAAFTRVGYDKGRPRWVQAMWFALMNLVFIKWWCPASLRPVLLRMFGARVSDGVFIRHRVRILWPWKLVIGRNSWLGEGAWLLNLELISIGSNVCVSQEALLCTGGHDPRSETFEYRNAPITLEGGAWIGARATVLPGVTVGAEGVVGAGAVVARDVPSGATVVFGGRLHNQ
jgi:putative colanic acid biosynthesis acetyltransferase WcaF